MYIAVYNDRKNDYLSLGRTKKEAVDSMVLTLKNHAYNKDELLNDEEALIDSINVYSLSAGETVLEGWGMRYKNGIKKGK